MMKILFCNIAWMKYYRGTSDEDIPINGGSYVDKNHRANEELNFAPFIIDGEDGEPRTVVLGSFETKATNGATSNQVHIEKIKDCAALAKEDYANDVLVIWCATSPSGESRVVGWYKNATICRWYDSIPIDCEDGTSFNRVYNIAALASDAVLLPENKRNRHIWKAPRKNSKTGTPYGFFRANVWYGLEDKAQEFIKRLVDNIYAYDEENAMEYGE
jgi:hypothetical protein